MLKQMMVELKKVHDIWRHVNDWYKIEFEWWGFRKGKEAQENNETLHLHALSLTMKKQINGNIHWSFFNIHSILVSGIVIQVHFKKDLGCN